MSGSGIITLTTDFGLNDPYVAIMKGVILSINPEACIIDISHGASAGAISIGAAMLQEAYGFFPKGTIHVGVIDPGVGGDRRPILIQTEDYFFVGPDNGLFFPIISEQEPTTMIHLTQKEYFLPHISSTFHGRDIFAPVAAHLSLGNNPHHMGVGMSDPEPLILPMLKQNSDALTGQVTRADHFGNLITNIHKKDLERFIGNAQPVIWVEGTRIENLKKTYSDAEEGEVLALIGSSEYLEIAVNGGRASDRLSGDSKKLLGMAVEVKQTGQAI